MLDHELIPAQMHPSHSKQFKEHMHSKKKTPTPPSYTTLKCKHRTEEVIGDAEKKGPGMTYRTTLRTKGNLILESWNCLMFSRLVRAAGTVAVLMICKEGYRTL